MWERAKEKDIGRKFKGGRKRKEVVGGRKEAEVSGREKREDKGKELVRRKQRKGN